MQLSKDLREFIELLNAKRIEYLVVGGFAVAWHGHPQPPAGIVSEARESRRLSSKSDGSAVENLQLAAENRSCAWSIQGRSLRETRL